MMLIYEIKVVPCSGKPRWALDKAGTIKCFLKNPAEKGLANAELIKRIAKICKVPQNNVSLIQGATTRKKVVKIDVPLTYEQFLDLLGLEKPSVKKDELGAQQSLFKKE